MFSENGEIILKNKEIANIFNDYFESIVKHLGVNHWDDHSLSPRKNSDRLENIIKQYKNHPSTRNIKANFNSVCIFSFQPVCVADVKTVIQDLKNNKSVGGEIVKLAIFRIVSKKLISLPFLEKMIHLINLITGLSAFYL